jgi:N-acetylmuramoyl-L-alanine amidase
MPDMTPTVLIVLAVILGALHHRPQDDPTDRMAFTRIRGVCLDPGHGGVNRGARSSIGIDEKTITLALAEDIRGYLTAHTDLDVVLTREADDSLSLPLRVAFANRVGADVFISLHLNSTSGVIAEGVETYFLSDEASDAEAARLVAKENLAPEMAEKPDLRGRPQRVDHILKNLSHRGAHILSQELAEALQDALVGEIHMVSRGVKSAPFTVLKGLTMPGVVLEMGFLSNPGEAEFILSDEYPPLLRDAVLSALVALDEDPSWGKAATAHP